MSGGILVRSGTEEKACKFAEGNPAVQRCDQLSQPSTPEKTVAEMGLGFLKAQ